MGRLQTKVANHEYRDADRLLIQQFIGGQNDDDMTDEIVVEGTTLENIKVATSECALSDHTEWI